MRRGSARGGQRRGRVGVRLRPARPRCGAVRAAGVRRERGRCGPGRRDQIKRRARGLCAVRYAGHDAAKAMAGAELVLLVGPAYSTEPLAAVTAPHLTRDMAVLICPGVVRRRDRVQAHGRTPARRPALRRRRDEHAAICGAGHRAGRRERLPQAHQRRLPRGTAAGGDRAALRPGQGRLAGRRASRKRLTDHAAERQPRHPSSGHRAQRRAARADRRQLPVLRGGRDRERRPADRGRRPRTARDRREGWA